MSTPKTVKVSDKERSPYVKIYLILYNALQVAGWSYILFQLGNYYLIKGPEFRSSMTLWDYTFLPVIIFQNAAFMEIINAACGFVKSNPLITTIQVLSRVTVVIGVVVATPTGKVSPGVPIVLFAWSVTEIIRYGYYAMNDLNFVPYILLFLRYTTFIVLYPIGVTGELLCFWWAQSYAKNNPNHLSIVMPNVFNTTFSYYILLWMIMASYMPIFPQMYLHMFAQRRKILGGAFSNKTLSKKSN